MYHFHAAWSSLYFAFILRQSTTFSHKKHSQKHLSSSGHPRPCIGYVRCWCSSWTRFPRRPLPRCPRSGRRPSRIPRPSPSCWRRVSPGSSPRDSFGTRTKCHHHPPSYSTIISGEYFALKFTGSFSGYNFLFRVSDKNFQNFVTFKRVRRVVIKI